MAVQPGVNDRVYIKKESTYGTTPAAPFISVPFFEFGLGAEQPLITPSVIGVSTNRDPGAPIKDVVTADGPAQVPVDVNNFGYWLNLLLGAPTTSGTTNYTHTFKSGPAALPSYSIEHAFPQAGNFALLPGVMGNGLSMNFQPGGEVRATIDLVAQGQTNNGSTVAGTPTSSTYTPFGSFQGTIKRDGSALALASEATLSFSNNLEPIRTIRSDGKVDGFIPGITNAGGNLTVYFSDTALLTLATNGTACAIELAYTIDANRSLVITMGEVYLPVPKLITPGPGGVKVTFAYQAAFKTADSTMLTAVLKNQTVSY